MHIVKSEVETRERRLLYKFGVENQERCGYRRGAASHPVKSS